MPWLIGRYVPGVDADDVDLDIVFDPARIAPALREVERATSVPCEAVQDEGPSRYAHVQAALVHGAEAVARFCLVYLCPWPGDDEDTYARVLRRR